MSNFSTDEIASAINAIGFESLEQMTQAFTLSKSLIDAGISDPKIFVPTLKRFILQDAKLKIQTQKAGKLADQQQQIGAVMAAFDPEINALNSQINDIDAQLAQLQG
jgi:hypothetical protein